MFKGLFTGAFLLISLFAVPSNATVIGFDIAWTGSNGFTMTGAFSFDNADAADGAIIQTELISLSLQGFQNGGLLGTFDLGDLSVLPPTFVFNFDPIAEAFLVGGGTSSTSGQCINCESTAVGIGFISGSSSQLLALDGAQFGASSLPVSQSTLTATRKIPEPIAVAIFGGGLFGMVLIRRQRRKIPPC